MSYPTSTVTASPMPLSTLASKSTAMMPTATRRAGHMMYQGQRRQIIWDEENRIRAIADNGSAHHYIYDASGTRVLKGKSNGQSIRVNGEWKAGSGNMGNYTVYVNPYLVLRSGGYTKPLLH